MLGRTSRIVIEFPALDALVELGERLLDIAEEAEQSEIDALTEELTKITAELAESKSGLQTALDNAAAAQLAPDV